MSRRVRQTAFAVVTAAPFILAFALAGACKDATQIELIVESDVPCPQLQGVSITVGPNPETTESRASLAVTTTTHACEALGANSRIGSLVITPNGDGLARGAVVVVAGVGQASESCTAATQYAGCIVARRFFAFAEHTSLSLVVKLSSACLGVACGAGSTCENGVCQNSEVSCGAEGCTPPGASADGGGPGVDPDAQGPTDGESPDAPRSGDAGDCSKRGQPLLCPPANGTACEKKAAACCVCEPGGFVPCGFTGVDNLGSLAPGNPGGGEIAWEYACATACNGTANLACFSAGNCRAGEVCCLNGTAAMKQSTCATQCPTLPGYAIACQQDCECPPSKTCLPLADNGYIKVCQ